MFRILSTIFFVLLLAPRANAQYCPANIDFETGTTANWQFFRGSVAIGPVYSFTACPAIYGLHTITSGADTDYYGGFPIVGGGSYSLKLSHDTANNNADKARYNIHIPGGGTIYNLVYHYATVLEDPKHTAPEQPRMKITAVDSATGHIIGCDSIEIVASNALFGFKASDKFTTSGDTTYYRPWTAGIMNFQGYGGHTITVDFTAGGCSAGGHMGYGYIDMGCGLFASVIPVCGAPTTTLYGPPGYLHYKWCDSATMGVTIDTTRNVTVPTPSTHKKYALIGTPYPGYGCIDTLYTEIVSFTPCSGSLLPKKVYAKHASSCGDFDTLVVENYTPVCDIDFQWQYSSDRVVWTDIAGAIYPSCPYSYRLTDRFYRCMATCALSGISTPSAVMFVPGGKGPNLTSISAPPDSTCPGVEFYMSLDPCVTYTTPYIVTNYGDGCVDTSSFSSSTPRFMDVYHPYTFPGAYSIKQIVYDGSLAIDSVATSFEHLFCGTLPVDIYFDANGNNIKDPGETNFIPLHAVIDSNGIAIDTVSATSRFYYRPNGIPGTIYTFRLMDYPTSIVVSSPISGTVSDTVQLIVDTYNPKSFGLSCGAPGFDLMVHNIIKGSGKHFQQGNVFARNNGPCNAIGSSELILSFSPKYLPASLTTTPAYTSISGSRVKWDVDWMDGIPKVFNYSVSYKGWFQLPIGDTVQILTTVNPEKDDWDTTNNSEVVIDTVKSGFDPNFISVTPSGCLASGKAANTLRYTVAFENTGNDTARNIYVMDTLSDNVDPRSLEIVDVSARMNIALFNVDGRNIVKFDFPHINLLDSSHHGQCEGMVMYSVKTKAGLANGTSIANHAGIFFDINPAVLTNTVENIIGCDALGVKNLSADMDVELYPNPAKDELVINADKNAYNSFSVTDQVGRVLVQNTITNSHTKVNTKALAPGLYYITLKGSNGATVRKFVKL